VTRYKIIIEYDGTPFVGWQKQENGLAVQECIEESIFQLFEERTSVYGAGRTDTGVHAMGQVGHFDINEKYLDPLTVTNGLNNYLKPNPVSIINTEKVDDSFHARFSAKERKYIYRIINRSSPLTFEKNRAWHVFKDLNLDKMIECISFIEGKHDFTTFRSSHCQSESPIKTLKEVKITKQDEDIYFGFVAKSFLHHQVRSLVGSLKLVGENTWTPQDFQIALQSKDRSRCGALAPPKGLYFMDVKY